MPTDRNALLEKEYNKNIDMLEKYEEMILAPKDGVDAKFVMESVKFYRASVERFRSALFKDLFTTTVSK